MKNLVFGLFALIAVTSSCGGPAQKELSTLDSAIENRAHYDALYDARMQTLKEQYSSAPTDSAKWEAACEIEDLFYIHNLDSCDHYIRQMLRLQDGSDRQRIISNSRYAHNLYRTDSLTKASKILDQFPLDVLKEQDKETVSAYCRSAYQVYRSLHLTDKFQESVNLWWQTDSTNSGAIFNHDHQLRRDRRYDQAIENLSKAVCHSQRDTAVLYYYLGRLHQYAGRNDQAIKYYAIGSTYDMYVSGKTYESLQILSRILFETGQTRRAERYLRIALTDAQASHWALRYNAIIESELTVMNALLKEENQKRRVILVAVAITSILLLVAAILLMYISRQANKISRSEKKLREVSSIKDSFLARYMETSVDYLNKVDEYRSSLRATAKSEGMDAVRAMLRRPSFAQSEFQDLLSNFDSTFLGIFPDFVEKVNSIMQEEYRLEQPSPGTLSTELRILALIRMGISKRQRIARVLNMSVTTVYSYHSNLMKHSLHPDHSFDKVVAGL